MVIDLKCDCIGILFDDPDGAIKKDVLDGPYAFMTNDQRLLKAFELCGYRKIGKITIDGIERFM